MRRRHSFRQIHRCAYKPSGVLPVTCLRRLQCCALSAEPFAESVVNVGDTVPHMPDDLRFWPRQLDTYRRSQSSFLRANFLRRKRASFWFRSTYVKADKVDRSLEVECPRFIALAAQQRRGGFCQCRAFGARSSQRERRALTGSDRLCQKAA